MAYKFFTVLITVLQIAPLTAAPLLPDTVDDTVNEVDDELIFVQAVWRHGDRSPTTAYANDPYQEDSWPQGWGELSKIGMEQHFRLGQKLRRRYVHEAKFLSPSYHNYEVFVRSTDWNRTVVSAISNFVGFYSTVGDEDEEQTAENSSAASDDRPHVEGWPTNFLPIPVHTVSKEIDRLGNTGESLSHCGRAVQLIGLITKTPQYLALVSQSQDLFQRLTDFCGQPIDDSYMSKLWDTLFIEKIYNRTQPWLTDELWAEIDTFRQAVRRWKYGIGLDTYNGMDFGVELARIQGGPILWEIIEHMRTKAKCNDKIWNSSTNKSISAECKWINPLKYFVYSAHDETLAAIFSTFGTNKTSFNKDENPYYSTALTVELWKTKSGAYNVKVLLWDPLKPDYEVVTDQIVGCESGCDLDRFSERSQPYRPVPDIQTLCVNDNLLASENSANLSKLSGAMILAGLTVLLRHFLWTIFVDV